MQPIQGRLVCDEITDLGGYSKAGRILAVLVGHIGHVCLAMIHRLRRSSPICLAQSYAKTSQVQYSLHLASFERSGLIPRPDEIPVLRRMTGISRGRTGLAA